MSTRSWAEILPVTSGSSHDVAVRRAGGQRARTLGRLVLDGATVNGSYGEISGTHVSEATALWLQTLAPLSAGDTVELQKYFRAADGYFAANHTSFWSAKIG